jgi:diaminopropionate ammonia-lyase family
MSETRRLVHFNPTAQSWTALPRSEDAHLVRGFHERLPGYRPTRLAYLEHIARETGVGAVYVKDESDRLGLPSFKILGASWGTFRSTVQRLRLPLNSAIEDVRIAAIAAGLKLFAATDGNHGRAVARMGSVLGVTAQIHVPAGMHALTKQAIVDEGAEVVQSLGNYDQSIFEARDAAVEHPGGILVQDYAFDGYEELPQVRVS